MDEEVDRKSMGGRLFSWDGCMDACIIMGKPRAISKGQS